VASGSLGVLGIMMSSEWVHQLLLLFVILFMMLSFPSAYKMHRQYTPSLFGLSGLVGLIIAMTLGHDFETVFTVIGSTLLMIAHLWNQRLSLSLA
jgi:urea transporter